MLKEKIKRRTLVYWLYIFYHLFFREKIFLRRKSYSQFGEDYIIDKYFSNYVGKYVDIGCYHPIRYNNTQLLHMRGWNGINIDINPTSIDLFNLLRKKDKNIHAAISDKTGQKKFYFQHPFSTVNTFNKLHLEKYAKDYQSYKVKTVKFSDLIESKFDFLNIDCEGDDFKILKTINLKKYQPKLICLEILENKDKNLVYKYLKKNKYSILCVKKLSHIFKKNNFLI